MSCLAQREATKKSSKDGEKIDAEVNENKWISHSPPRLLAYIDVDLVMH